MELHKIMPPHAFLFDLVHYAGKLQPEPLSTGKWPLGATLRPSYLGKRYPAIDSARGVTESLPGVHTSAKPCIRRIGKKKKIVHKEPPRLLAPSIAAALRDFTNNDCYKPQLHLFSANTTIRTDLMEDAWKHALSVTTRCTPTETFHIPISTVEHDNTQLVWNRVSVATNTPVDTCAYGADCEAHKIRANQGALQRYMTASEQVHFDAT